MQVRARLAPSCLVLGTAGLTSEWEQVVKGSCGRVLQSAAVTLTAGWPLGFFFF